MKLRVFVTALALGAATPAWAGSYTLADIVGGAGIGLSDETLLRMVDSPVTPWVVDGETAVRLLRSGVSPTVVAALSGGEHPTPGELTRATEAGPKWSAEEAAAPATPPTVAAAEAPAPEPPVAEAPAAPDASAAPDDDDDPSYAERIRTPAAPALGSVHAGARSRAEQAVYAGAGTSVAGLAVLAATGVAGDGENGGLTAMGTGFATVGGTSVIAGSLLAARALRRDGYRVTSAPGWIGAGAFSTGVLTYAGTWLVQGEPSPSTPGAVLMTGGVAMGLVQAAVNSGQRRRQLRGARLDAAELLPFPDDTPLAWAGDR